jgi:hypothetical protein
MDYSVNAFWKKRLSAIKRPSLPLPVAGWSVEPPEGNTSFVEAALALRSEAKDLSQPIWFVAAPGAVGKSTLAREISAQTAAVYLDLASAETVAGNYLTGGLVKAGLLDSWYRGETTVLIDALDEARLRVTQNSFIDFLRDVQTMSNARSIPTVLFGRVGIVEEAWFGLADLGIECPIFDIDFFEHTQSVAFIMTALHRLSVKPAFASLSSSLAHHRSRYQVAAERLVRDLESAAPSDGTRFAGYAPVLEAVATALADINNPSAIDDSAQQTIKGQILSSLADRILSRESEKLRAQLPDTISSDVKTSLYNADEQLARLSSEVYNTPRPPVPQSLSEAEAAAYDRAVNEFVSIHPFLDGTGEAASSTVFAAAISAHALLSADHETRQRAQQIAQYGPHAPNPFLISFYLNNKDDSVSQPDLFVRPEHVVLLYESVIARARAGEILRLNVEGDEDTEQADVEIEIGRPDTPRTVGRILFRTSQAGELRFGRQFGGVAIDAPHLDVQIGVGNPVEILTPVSISVERIRFACPELVVAKGSDNPEGQLVILEASQNVLNGLHSMPKVREGVTLEVFWPNSSAYPWSRFATLRNEAVGPDVHNDLNNLRRLVLAFRSHSRGRLARFKDKVEHVRMTKGQRGVALREKMLRDGILSLEGEMYFLDPSALGKATGASYQDIKLKKFNRQTRDYVSQI